ncbi:TrwC relaxase [Mycobacteroides abscessus subsp. bolletii]|uniref:TrwC relaxase n=1 Tax=Mycobacteroides abscessus subsp. bolletii TaxID=319705 RepID=A0A9Q7SD93_9MYCO|nr:helicase C-terminal domain-containing protein [Mycobacteroides abscessus]SHU25972.1 TrwC relaxase [Mycobacteroides abscessus subsp. bolletii]SHV22180.1 TrwC relaxase [Mycobacteroides abscessus subsp. bolletii]SHX20936.1 TrwC relaxase [Mycobacteroides abscessus subsp. bolletii]SKL38122.1 TrwC relaxase [Mycobacteroides abscessus subsp. bolletii]SKM62994.1 TrwC relaxase [Mycobacteroides abscessus subsp. bolletii]
MAIIDTNNNLIACERLDDKARAVFDQTYFREHVSLGYAVTVHSAQGVTADTSIAVLSGATSRNLLYVAMTRGRHANIAHIYEHSTEAGEFSHERPSRTHVAQRGDSHEAATLVHGILCNDEQAITAHDYASHTADEALPQRVRSLLNTRAAADKYRRDSYQAWKSVTQERDCSRVEAQARDIDRRQHRSADYGLEL